MGKKQIAQRVKNNYKVSELPVCWFAIFVNGNIVTISIFLAVE